jgi:hypothetical protein
VRHGTKHVRAPRKRRTSENAVKRKFAVFHKSEVQLRRILIPRTPVNKYKKNVRAPCIIMSVIEDEKKGGSWLYIRLEERGSPLRMPLVFWVCQTLRCESLYSGGP